MATDDDNFDIDIYGDGAGTGAQDDTDLVLDAPENLPAMSTDGASDQVDKQSADTPDRGQGENTASSQAQPAQGVQQANAPASAPQQPAAQNLPSAPQGTKRKEFEGQSADPASTTALILSELHWWTTEDNVREWIHDAGAIDGLKDLTFSEHKVNGKSKGQVFAEFTSPHAAAASKTYIEGNTFGGRQHTAVYTSPHVNPYRTLPKDAPVRRDIRENTHRNAGPSGPGMNNNPGFGGNNNPNFRGRGHQFNGRGNNSHYQNRGGHFNQGYGGGPGQMVGGFQPMAPNYGYNNRGNMMGGMRGRGRGGHNMGGPVMPPMPMAGGMAPMGPMGMAPMMMPNMGGMGGNMNMQGQPPFQAGGPFNQGGFHQGGGNPGSGPEGPWNPHGAKRSRQD